MKIVDAGLKDVDECVDLIFRSVLGKKYYPKREMLYDKVRLGIEQDCFFAAWDEDGQLMGILWYQPEGMFHSFPYVHMLAVDEKYQHQGIGTKLMDFLEKDVLTRGGSRIRTKLFLVTADFTPVAEQMYIDRGFEKLCEIPGLFRRNVTEKLYMKIVIGE